MLSVRVNYLFDTDEGTTMVGALEDIVRSANENDFAIEYIEAGEAVFE